MKRIFVPLTWEANEGKEEILTKLKNINEEPLIAGIEINLVDFFQIFSGGISEVVKSLALVNNKPLFGVCGLESKGDIMPQEEKIKYFIKALKAGFNAITLEYTQNFEDYIDKAIKIISDQISDFQPKQQLSIEYANFDDTPVIKEAEIIIENMLKHSPAMTKFITMVNTEDQNQIFYKDLANKISS